MTLDRFPFTSIIFVLLSLTRLLLDLKMSNTAVVLQETEAVYPLGAPGFTPGFVGGVRVAPLLSFLYYAFCSSCVLYPMLVVTLHCPFGFL